MRLIDSHCHLQADRFAGDVDLVVGAARLAGVERLLVPGWDLASSRGALDLVVRYPWMDAAVGVHPHDADRADVESWASIAALASGKRVVAIGETGLDFDRVFSPIPEQIDNLRRNLDLALSVGKPAILHCRSAAGRRDAHDTLLEEFRRAGFGTPSVRDRFGGHPAGVIHSYSGPIDYARDVLGLGLAISISGLAFRSGEEATAEVVRLVPADCLLVETDAPFLSPPGARRKRNEPEWVRITAAWVAEQRGEDPDAFGVGLVSTYDRIFAGPNDAGRASRPAGSSLGPSWASDSP